MKKIYLILIAIIALTACEDFLGRRPYDKVSSETAFESAILAENVVNGVYSNLIYDYVTVDAARVNWDAFSSVIDPTSSLCNSKYNYLTGKILTNNSMFLTYWKRYYEGINRANDVINNIHRVPDMTDELKAKRIAECKFIRAYHYYRLNCLWRGVPIYLENYAPSEYTKPRSSEEDVWQQIIDDCTDAINCTVLPDKIDKGSADYGRITKGAAYTLRGKVYMWLKEYELAEDDFLEVGKLGHSLYTGGYEKLFTEANERCDEMIFSAQMVAKSGNGNCFSYIYGSYCTTGFGNSELLLNTNFVNSYEEKNGKPFDWNNYIPGYNEMSPKERSVYFLRNNMSDTEISQMATYGAKMSEYDATGNEARIKTAYANRDPRLAATAITPYAEYKGGASGAEAVYTMRYPYRNWEAPQLDLRGSQTNQMLYMIRKFVTVGRESTNIQYNPIDAPIFRYADVLLSLAEAINEQGRYSEAMTYVNQVRSRAGVQSLGTNEYTQVLNKDQMRERIYKEKKWELACEEQLYYEELRWETWKKDKFSVDNGLQQVWGDPVYTYSWGGEEYWKWPIPSTEREKNNNLKQNDGWL